MVLPLFHPKELLTVIKTPLRCHPSLGIFLYMFPLKVDLIVPLPFVFLLFVHDISNTAM